MGPVTGPCWSLSVAEPAQVVEVRCPAGPQRLFTKLRLGQTTAQYIQPDNLIEFSCGDCARLIARANGLRVTVLHRFNFVGELVQTLTRPREQQG